MKLKRKYNRAILIAMTFVQLLIFASPVKSDEILTLNGLAPSNLVKLNTSLNLSTGYARNSGPHGQDRVCYKTPNGFVVYETNLLGEGYELCKNKPSDFHQIQCQQTTEQPQNPIGISINTHKSYIESKLGVKITKPIQTIRWLSTKIIDETQFDIQTTAELEFQNSKLIRLWVFTTETN